MGHGFEPHRCHCARHIYPSLVLVQPRKTRPCLTERFLMGHKESNQTNKQYLTIWSIFFKFFAYQALADSGSTGHKNVPNIVSLCHCLEQLYSCIFNSYVKPCLNIWWRPMYGLKLFFCLLPVGVCINAYMMIGCYILCVSTH